MGHLIRVTSAEQLQDAYQTLVTAFNEKGFIEIEWHAMRERSGAQNNAMHLYFRLYAKALNDAGFDMCRTLKEGAEIPWTEDSFKREIWLPVMESMHGHTSTRDLTRTQVGNVAEAVCRHLLERTGVFVPFPEKGDG